MARVRPPPNTAWSRCRSNPLKSQGPRRTAALVSCFRLGYGGMADLSGAASQLPLRRGSDFRLHATLGVRWCLSSSGRLLRFLSRVSPLSGSMKLQAQLFLFLSLVFWESVVRLSPRSTSGLRCQARGRLKENPCVWETAGNAHVGGRQRLETTALSTRLAAQQAAASR